jgi:hypothetical protein
MSPARHVKERSSNKEETIMTRLSMMLLGVIAVSTGIALALTMPRQETTEEVPLPAPVQKANLAPPPPVPSAPRLADRPADPVDPAVEAADLEDGSGS